MTASLSPGEPRAADAAAAESTVPAELGQRLRRQRLAAGLTLEQLAARAGFGMGYLSRIENGKKIPPIATLSRLAGVLGIELRCERPSRSRARHKSRPSGD